MTEPRRHPGRALALTGASCALGLALCVLVHRPDIAGQAGPGLWVATLGLWLLASLAASDLAALSPSRPMGRRVVALGPPPAVRVPRGRALGDRDRGGRRAHGADAAALKRRGALRERVAVLAADFVQTFVKAALPGYALGNLAGLGLAILADRVPVLRRGVMPVANFASALPIVGVAPIMVMWFGFDWPSKAAVVALMTFFPMLVQASAGLAATGRLERDLMRSYAAGYGQTLLLLRLPTALPFLFTALKVNATLALIGAIVAEFFGTPIVGMGFRISIEAARLALDMVWAEIALAGLAGSGFYGLVALIERATTHRPPPARTA